jgi:hypothetical protein
VETGFAYLAADEYDDVGVVFDDENAFHFEPGWGNSGRSVQQEEAIGEGRKAGGEGPGKGRRSPACRGQTKHAQGTQSLGRGETQEGHNCSCPNTI